MRYEMISKHFQKIRDWNIQPERPNDFGLKYGNKKTKKKNITKKIEWINNATKELEEL